MTNPKAFPTFPEAYWQASCDTLQEFPALKHNHETDVAVIGGGISGITTAYVLAKAGFKVALIDAGRLLNGTTGHTTAKITAQHDLIYDELIQREGKEKALLYYQANTDALHFIQSTVEQLHIDCGFEEQDACIYTNTDSGLSQLEKELEAYNTLGIPSSYQKSIPLPIPALGALTMPHQAQFHPLRYLAALVKEFVDTGGEVFEYTTAVDIENGSIAKVVTRDGHHVSCRYVVSCTHFPFHDGGGFYFARMHADRSYVLGVKLDEAYPSGMYLSADEPKRSIRSVQTGNGDKLVLIGGQSHKTGQGICTINHYEALQQFAAEHFKLKEISYRWSAQDLVTGDKTPFIGPLTSSVSNVYVATGYRKWGMTTGTAAALLLRDLLQEKENPYIELYSPSRLISWHTVQKLVSDNADVAKHLIAGKLEMVYRKPEDLLKDEGGAITLHGRRAGGYRDKEDKLHLVDTTCTHMGCEVEWNDGERTWDCPCHGSRFSYEGDVMEGPAKQPLTRLHL
ncbi:FAD-dependent oxidoreductase [Paenibacillus sp. FSL H8-0537]|uniref:FAD-dependent oxidoreductase n=1 Tax=Paenibacillus sp. FSL H8-0537 TaxID=2921399 RepID=UPI003100F1CB